KGGALERDGPRLSRPFRAFHPIHQIPQGVALGCDVVAPVGLGSGFAGLSASPPLMLPDADIINQFTILGQSDISR
ncbi:MAG: hypothetical protein ABI680_13340, partial [Chthoniobacteraceae bacterium]